MSLSPHKDSNANVCVCVIHDHDPWGRSLEMMITGPGCDWSSLSSTLVVGEGPDNAKGVSMFLIA